VYVIRVSLNSSDAFSTWASVIVDIVQRSARRPMRCISLANFPPLPSLPPTSYLILCYQIT
jgi:hypothetical protein